MSRAIFLNSFKNNYLAISCVCFWRKKAGALLLKTPASVTACETGNAYVELLFAG